MIGISFEKKSSENLRLVLLAGKIITLEKGTELFIVQPRPHSSVVRKRGDTQKLWVTNEFIKKK
ncbi:MAG: hypothetical protein B7C24_07225 [Bacteroidetes bacterium 4572_77]|nr:MAG: hypothetical protein B7C24_07225 [Bacteroidetes bacterium 4572_77]